jgi:hypothetical protein
MEFPECSNSSLIRSKLFWLPLATFFCLQLMSTGAFAQDNRCPADVNGSTISCRANDVVVASVDYDPADLPATCIAGETIELAIVLGFEVNANARRDDIGVWIAKGPGDLFEPVGSGGPASCDLLVLGGPIDSSISPFPLVVDDLDGDACDDIVRGSQGEAFFEDFAPETIEVLCLPDENGQLTFQTVVTWDEGNGNNVCDGTPSSFDISNAKCRVDDPTVLPIDVLTSLTIEKQTDPDGSQQSFNYSGTVDGSAFSGFSLADEQFDTITGTLGDQFIVNESIATGWFVESIVCTDNQTQQPATATIDTVTGQVDITLDNNQYDVTCVYTNVQYPTLTIVKNTDGGNDTFDFNWSSTTNPGPNAVQLTTLNETASSNLITLTDGIGDTDYAVSEIPLPAGWEFVSASCSGASDNGTPGLGSVTGITINAGDQVTCTFDNQALGTIRIDKTAVGGDATFAYTSVSGIGSLGNAFTIIATGGGGSTGNIAGLSAGSYDVTETDPQSAPGGWDFTNLACVDPDDGSSTDGATATIDLDPGETIVCTYTNTERGTIRIDKATVGGDATFAYTSQSGLGSEGNAFSIGTSGNSGTTGDIVNLPPGAYDVTETDPQSDPGGWDFTSLACVDPDQGSGTDGATATIDLDAGETVVCTYTNTERGSITVVKLITGTEPQNKTFSFTGTGPDDFDFGGGFTLTPTDVGLGGADSSSPDYGNLVPGAYTVTEADPTGDGWQLVGVLCSGEDYGDPVTNPATIALDPGEEVTCTFTNAPLDATTIVKNSIGGEGVFGFTWGTQGNPNVPPNEPASFNLDTADGDSPASGTASQGFILNPQTDYDLSETSLPGTVDPYARSWSLTDLNCGDEEQLVQLPGANGADVTITGADGSSVTCTFTNTLEGALVVRKETLPNGFDQAFSFSGDTDLTGSIRDFSSFSEELVLTAQPGVFGTTENVPDGWVLSNISCTGATNSAVSIGTGGDFQSPGWDQGDDEIQVDLAAGEVVICTFENTKLGAITIEKIVEGTDASFDFQTSYDPGSFSLSNGQSNASGYLTSDTYTITETVTDGYELTDITCSGDVNSTTTTSDTGVQIGLVDGEEITCTFTNSAIARTALIAVQKFFTDGNDETPVTLTLKCTSGFYAPATVTVDPDEFAPGSAFEHIFVIDLIPQGAPNPCTVVEEPVPGYDPTYICGQDGSTSPVDHTLCNPFADFSDGTTACGWLDVQADDTNLCGIFNRPAPVDVDVHKVWEIVGATQADFSADVRISLTCDARIVDGDPIGDGEWRAYSWLHEEDGDFDDEDDEYTGMGTANFEVIPEFYSTAIDPDDQEYTECWANENIQDNAVEVTNGCGVDAESSTLEVAVGMGDECTITNTVFFEGIPTLSQWGMAIMALLMLGAGMVGFRRII